MKTVKLILLWIFSLLLVLFIVQNTNPVQSHFLWLTAEVPVFLLLVFATALGMVLGVLIALLIVNGPSKKQTEHNALPDTNQYHGHE